MSALISDDIQWLREKHLIIWGCGHFGSFMLRMLDDLEIPVLCVIDKKAKESNKVSIEGVAHELKTPDMLPDMLLEYGKDNIHICVVIDEAPEVITLLKNLELVEDKHYRHVKSQFKSAYMWDSVIGAIYEKYIKADWAKNPPMFQIIEIETISKCNNDCSFCPVGINHDTREPAYMEQPLFEKIISELREINYEGWIGLFSNNEPFLDPLLIRRLEYVKTALPNVRLQLYTNGTLLTLDKFLESRLFIDKYVINSYGDGLTLSENAQRIKDYLASHSEEDNKIEFWYRIKNEVLTSRGGRAPNRREYIAPKAGCAHPFFQTSLRANGKMYMCCNDALQDRCLGDANRQSIMEIWRGRLYQDFREKMIKYGRQGLSYCVNCDSYPSYYLYSKK